MVRPTGRKAEEMEQRKRSVLAALPLALLTVGVGLGTWLGVATAGPSASGLPPVLRQMVQTTTSAGSARYTYVWSVQFGGVPTRITESGIVDFSKGEFTNRTVSYETSTTSSGSCTPPPTGSTGSSSGALPCATTGPTVVRRTKEIDEAIVVGGFLYDRTLAPGEAASWSRTRLPVGTPSFGLFSAWPGGMPFDLLSVPGHLVDLVATRQTVLGGQPVTRYDVTSRINRAVCRIPDDQGSASTTVAMFVDRQGRLVLARMVQTLRLPTAAGLAGGLVRERSTVTFGDFGTAVSIEAPPVAPPPPSRDEHGAAVTGGGFEIKLLAC